MGRAFATGTMLAFALALAACGQGSAPAAPAAGATAKPATEPALVVKIGGAAQTFTAAQLLARSDVATIEVANDVAYKRPMRFRAVPFRALAPDLKPDQTDTLEVRATDGFVAQLPSALIAGEAVPWLAVEDSAHPWPVIPDKTITAGPFYLIWQNPERSKVSPEQWPYAMAAVTAVASPTQRWPGLAVDAGLPETAPARRGQAVFIANCLACHRAGGAGQANVGPDLLKPMPAVTYFTDAGLRALIRNPASVRNWPDQKMPAFEASAISDADVDAVLAYLHALAARAK